ncbi:phage holin family protein [Anaerotignum sp.]
MMNILNKVNIIGGAIMTALAAVLGRYWFLFAGFLLFNIIDWLTGWAKSSMQGESSSSIGAKGAMKKVGYWVVIGTAFFIGFSFEEMGEVIGVNLVFMDYLGWFVLANYLVNEIRSVLENLVEMDVDVPAFLVKGLQVTSEKLEARAKEEEEER